jgi:hypothetical protein
MYLQRKPGGFSMGMVHNAALVLLLYGVVPACAQQVYPGCAAPEPTPNHVWYIDAVNGSSTGNGSAASPWASVAQAVSDIGTGASPYLSTIPYHHRGPTGAWVISPNPNAPINPGDEILLMNGNYGNIAIGAYDTETKNPEFVTIAAAPGQTPVLATLLLTSTSNWIFSGLAVQSLRTSTNSNPLIFVKDQGASYPTSNIIFEGMTISSQANISGWTQAYWAANGRNGFEAPGSSGGANTTCISVTGSHITNVLNGVDLFANQTLFSGNEIDHFGDDALDYAASDLMITQNSSMTLKLSAKATTRTPCKARSGFCRRAPRRIISETS